MNRKIILLLIFILIAILTWFLFFFKINYEYEGFFIKNNNSIYFFSKQNILSNKVDIKLNSIIYEIDISFIENKNSFNIFLVNHNNILLEESKIIPIRILKQIIIINIFLN